jgi:crotonobetainyl-CoA:carnitine CoA-transferase CaiB-like acyl-CoA transferase
MLVPVEDPVLGPVLVPGIVPRLSDNPGAVRWGGRDVGADTRAALRDLAGLGDDEIDALEREGVVRCTPADEDGR